MQLKVQLVDVLVKKDTSNFNYFLTIADDNNYDCKIEEHDCMFKLVEK